MSYSEFSKDFEGGWKIISREQLSIAHCQERRVYQSRVLQESTLPLILLTVLEVGWSNSIWNLNKETKK